MTTTRRLAAILAADVAGYSRLMAADEAGTLARFKLLRSDHFEPAIRTHGGRLVGEAGDSLLVEFPSASAAVTCAAEVQAKLGELNGALPEDRRMRFRIGINLGEIIADGATIHGDGVNVAARLEKLAEPGGLVISGSVHEQIKGKVPGRFEDLGDKTLHNIADPVRAYRVLSAEAAGATSTGHGGEAARRRQSIAVLPFANMSGDPEQEYFSDGITEDLITALARHHGLFVIARNSSFVFKGKAAPIPEVGRQLGVRYVVEGSVRKAGKRIRITAQLIDAESGAHIWAEKYDRDLEDVFALQDEIVETLVWRVTGNLTKAEIARSKLKPTENLDAYDLYLRGVEVYESVTREGVTQAINIWQRASRLDPTWGRPQSRIAEGYFQLGFFDLDDGAFDRASEAAQRALTLRDPEDWTDGLIGLIAAKRGYFTMADVHMQRALARNPSDAMTLAAQGYSLLWRGEARKAIDIGLELRRLDPFDHVWVNQLLGYANYAAGNYEASHEAFMRCMPMGWWMDYGFLAACLGQLERNAEAKAAWNRMVENVPEITIARFIDATSVTKPEDKEHWRAGLLKAGLE